jgi:putative membrane protein
MNGTGGNARRGRFPASVYRSGEEPDPRFSLANERTFLAWIRTSLALLAAGVALEALELPIQPGFRIAASALFIVLGLLAALQSWLGWAATERSLRRGQALPGPTLGAVIALGVVAATVLVTLGFLLP